MILFGWPKQSKSSEGGGPTTIAALGALGERESGDKSPPHILLRKRASKLAKGRSMRPPPPKAAIQLTKCVLPSTRTLGASNPSSQFVPADGEVFVLSLFFLFCPLLHSRAGKREVRSGGPFVGHAHAFGEQRHSTVCPCFRVSIDRLAMCLPVWLFSAYVIPLLGA